jgi:hypothetical protein
MPLPLPLAIDDAIEQIVDGSPLDWDALDSQAGDEEKELLKYLRILGDIAGVHRTTVEDTAELAVAPPHSDDAIEEAADVERWGRYRLREKVGEGSFGSVYRGFDPDLQREIAVKILHNRVGDGHLKERLLIEGRALARVRHANVVSVFAVEAHGGRVGLCMEFVHGATLESELLSSGPFTERDAASVGEEVCRALSAVHEAGFVHRDVKGRNVMREAGGRIVLMDFGTGRDAVELKTSGRIGIAGTPLYMAPEVLAGLPASASSDIYSVGVLLYHLLTGAYPVEGQSIDELRAAHMQGRRRTMPEQGARISRRFQRVLDRALSPDPQRRYETAEALGAALHGLSRTARAIKAARIALAILAAPPLVLVLLGVLTTYNFNLTLGRAAPFNRDSLGLLLKLGWQSAFTTMLGAAVIGGVIGAAGRLLRPLRRLGERLARRCSLDDPAVLAQTVSIVAIVALVLIGWTFWDVVRACLSNINTSSADRLRPLREGQTGSAFVYRLLLNALAVAIGATLLRIHRRRPQRRPAVSAGIYVPLLGLLAVTVVLSELPYRIIWQSRVERVAFRTERCYVLGASEAQSLIYCPDKVPPRNRVVDNDDQSVRRTGIVESIFSLPDASR